MLRFVICTDKPDGSEDKVEYDDAVPDEHEDVVGSEVCGVMYAEGAEHP